MIENNIIGIILAGGKSSRFGEDKSNIRLGNKTLLDHTINKSDINKLEQIEQILNIKQLSL